MVMQWQKSSFGGVVFANRKTDVDLGESLKINDWEGGMNNSFGYFRDDRKIGNCTVVGEVFFDQDDTK